MTLKSLAAISALMALAPMGGLDPHFETRNTGGALRSTNRPTGQRKIQRAAKKRRRQQKAKR